MKNPKPPEILKNKTKTEGVTGNYQWIADKDIDMNLASRGAAEDTEMLTLEEEAADTEMLSPGKTAENWMKNVNESKLHSS